MSALRHACRFTADRLREFLWLIIGGGVVLTIPWIIDYLTDRNYKGGPASLLIFPAIVGIGLLVLWLLVLAIELYRKGVSIRRYGALSKEEAAEFHERIANLYLKGKGD